MSYGLSFLLGIRHGLGNCVVFQHLHEYYPEGVALFKEMLKKQQIKLPSGLCADLSEDEMDHMCDISLRMEPLWVNALGTHWRQKIDKDTLKEIYRKI